jgi:hypothetical protein
MVITTGSNKNHHAEDAKMTKKLMYSKIHKIFEIVEFAHLSKLFHLGRFLVNLGSTGNVPLSMPT